jgi:hypothetical protein
VKIEKENIESFIFDYHEGNLSDSEKTEVLNYIHNHPEYEVAFTLWAQSYLPHESTVKNYGLTNHLLQTPSTDWYNKSWIKITAPILLISFISFFYHTTEESTSLSTPHTKNNTRKQHSVVKTKVTTTTELKSTNTNKPKETPTPIVIHKLVDNKSRPEINSIIESPISSTPIETNPTIEINTSINIQETKSNTSDSVITVVNITETNKKVDESKKKKSYKIKPTTDFIPTNPNF